jgi:hypothetical protein
MESATGVDNDEPARMAQYIVLNRRDYRELLTADYTVDKTGNRVMRPASEAAGVLSTPQFLTARYGLLRRGWASTVIRDFLGIRITAVVLPPNGNPDVGRAALAANPGCAGCHADKNYGIDLIASMADCYPKELGGQRDKACVDAQTNVLGRNVVGLPGLGREISTTSEFVSVAIGFFYERLYGRTLSSHESEFYARTASHFVETLHYDALGLIQYLATRNEFCDR